MGAVGLRGAVAILLAISGVTLLVGAAHAETPATSTAELEAPDSADPEAGDAKPFTSDAERRREQRELQAQRRERWWADARAVLFSDIELSAEQSRGVDAIIETQLHDKRRFREVQGELAAEQQGDRKRRAALQAESRELRTRRRGPHECMEAMRALLSEEQRPTFDMNRARLAAEGQEPQERRRRRKPRAGAEVEGE